MLGAFISGNIKSQLERNTKEDSPYPGILQTLKVYRQIKAKDNKASIPELEKFAKLEAEGKLKTFLLNDDAPVKGVSPERPANKQVSPALSQ